MSEVATPDLVDQFCASDGLASCADRSPAVREAFAVDGIAPAAVVTPEDVSGVQRCLSEAQNAGLAVVPWGSGGQQGLGNTLRRYDVALSLRKLNRIVAHVPEDMTVTVEAGVTLAQLASELAAHGQFLPLRPTDGSDCTIGGMLATNDQGTARYAFGTARDWLIGITLVCADGTLARSGGRVVKNVAGYDLGKLLIGSLGTLGVITEATFKVAPLPAADVAFASSFASPHACAMFLLAARDESLALNAAELLSPVAAESMIDSRRWSVFLRIAGGSGAVERTLRDVRELADSLRGDVADLAAVDAAAAWERCMAPAAVALRCAVLPSQVADAVDAIAELDEEALISATLGAGVIRIRYPHEPEAPSERIDDVRVVVARFGGSAVVERAPASVKAGIDVFGPSRRDFAIMGRLKDAFDPEGILAPGRFLGRL